MKRKLDETTSAGGIAVGAAASPKPKIDASIYTGVKQKSKTKAKSAERNENVNEDELAEDEVLIVPGRLPKRKTGFVPREMDRTDHEVAMARSDLLAAFKNAKTIYGLLKDRSEEVGIEGWVQEKLIKANDYLNAVREYYEEQAVQSDLDGKYGMQSTCDCGPQCECGPDFGSMFESAMTEKAKSKQQQKFFGMVHALQKGEEIPGASAKLKKTAASMSKGDVKDFAKTKHSGLPTKVKKKS